MKTFRLWHLVAVGVVLSLLSTQVRGEDKKQMERKAKAALALAAAKGPPGFVNLAPLPREIPKDMPKKPCVCGDDCKCKAGDCPAKCPVEPVVVPKKDKKADPSQPAPVGYQWQKWPGEDWKLVPVSAAQGVAAPRPFASAGTTPTTPVIGAAVPSTSSSGFYPAASTFTLAPGAGIPGVTNCAPGGA